MVINHMTNCSVVISELGVNEDNNFPWRGDKCEGSYLDDKVFYGFFQLYAIGEVLLQVVAVAYASWQLYIILKYASKKVYFALPTYIMVIAIVAGLSKMY